MLRNKCYHELSPSKLDFPPRNTYSLFRPWTREVISQYVREVGPEKKKTFFSPPADLTVLYHGKKLKNVSRAYDRLHDRNSTLQAA